MKRDRYKTLNIRPETHQLLKIEAAITDTELCDLMDLAWAAYLRAKGEPPPPSSVEHCPYRPENRQFHEMLEELLNDPDEGEIVRSVLRWVRRVVGAKSAP